MLRPKRLLESETGPDTLSARSGATWRGARVTQGDNVKERTQHVVDRAFQMRVAVSLTMIATLVPAVLVIGMYLVWKFAVIQNPDLAELPIGQELFLAALKSHWWIGALCIAAYVAFAFAIVFYYTHRIAGPVYRFRWLFDELAEGRIHTQVQLRQGDSFENLAASMLRAHATLASAVTQLKAAAVAASQQAGAVQNPALSEQLNAIQRILDRYRVVVPQPAESQT